MKNTKKHYKSISFKLNDGKKIQRVNSPFATKEAYSGARTNLMFSNKGEECPVYIVTSAVPNEGKSITCVNLAISFAMMGKNTLIIDFDMRNPTIHRFFKQKQEHGVSELLAGMEQEINYQKTTYDNLWILHAGMTPPNPSELLSGEITSELLKYAKKKFDYIFIDTPPIEIVTDVSIVAEHATGVIIVVRSGNTESFVLKHSVSLLENVKANIVGFILNDSNPKNQGYSKKYAYKNKYSGYYGD